MQLHIKRRAESVGALNSHRMIDARTLGEQFRQIFIAAGLIVLTAGQNQ
jgi:hypothetical protein